MTSRFVTCFAASLVGAVAAGTAAMAQTPSCERYRAELASLPRQGGADPRARQFEAAAQRQRAELDRTRAYASQLGCNRGLVLFGPAQAPECGGLQTRMRQMEANLDQLSRQADQLGGGPGLEMRRRQLLGLIDRDCRATATPARQPGFFERLFGGSAEPELPQQQFEPTPLPEGPVQPRVGGSRAVCVRTCDGYFFPLPTGGREGAGEMCQALCPATETQVYFMSQDGDIERAASQTGRPYTDLPNASRYKKAFDPGCACRREGETWVQALRNAEELIGSRKTDIIVTSQKAEELSRPKAPDPKTRPNDPRNAKGKPTPQAESEPTVDKSFVPTAGAESAGIGPQTIGTEQTVGQREGQFRDIIDANGQKRRVRVVAPNIFVDPTAQPR